MIIVDYRTNQHNFGQFSLAYMNTYSIRDFIKTISLVGFTLLFAGPVYADEPTVLKATVRASSNGSYVISATILHKDEGWEHYVNKFDVLGPNGGILGTRILYHPHVSEQPFTRSLTNVKIPAGLKSVLIRAHDLVHGYGDNTFKLTLPK